MDRLEPDPVTITLPLEAAPAATVRKPPSVTVPPAAIVIEPEPRLPTTMPWTVLSKPPFCTVRVPEAPLF